MSDKPTKRVTVEDLAKSLGVGHTTVRKALNDLPGVSEKIRARVKAEAARVGYFPNLLARSLKQQKSNLIGLVVMKSLQDIWYASLVDRLIAALDAKGYGVILSRIDQKGQTDKVRKTLEGLLGGHVAGVIAGPLAFEVDVAQFDIVTKNDLPLVVFDNVEDVGAGSVSIDHQKGVKSAISHFVENGHRRIGYLCCRNYALPNTRRYGYEKALTELDLPLLGKDIIYGDITFEGGYQAAAELLSVRPKDLPTAFFCHSDICALGAMKAFCERGVRIPEDISLIGYDDIPEASYGIPGLTTVGGVIGNMTEKMADMICGSIEEGTNTRRHELIAPRLIARGSVQELKPQWS
jgi:LacI family transcriptional regulator